jgi:hypothetical protein
LVTSASGLSQKFAADGATTASHLKGGGNWEAKNDDHGVASTKKRARAVHALWLLKMITATNKNKPAI